MYRYDIYILAFAKPPGAQKRTSHERKIAINAYGVFALSGQTIAILAIIAATLIVVSSFLMHVFDMPTIGFVLMIASFVLCGILAVTFWTLPGIWAGSVLTLAGGFLILVLPFFSFVEHE